MSSSGKVIGVVVLCAAIGAGALLVTRVLSSASQHDDKPATYTPPQWEHKNADAKPSAGQSIAGPASYAANVFIGRAYDGQARQIHGIYTTRKREVVYQALVQYQPETISLAEVPGASDIAQAFARMNKPLPDQLNRVDEESEMLRDNLGEPLRFISSYRVYFNILDGRAIAYELVQSSGGQPQRMLGHITREGVSIDVYRGTEHLDHHDVPFPIRETFIPVTYDFIHQWYQLAENKEAKEKKEQIKFSIFAPQAMALLLLKAKPLDEQLIPLGDANHNCAHYEVAVVSTRSGEGVQARQEMWFDKASGLLVRRRDYDPGLDITESPVTEREAGVSPVCLERMRELVEPVSELPLKPLPFALDTELLYSVKAREMELGRVRVKFSKLAQSGAPAEYAATAKVNLDAASAARQEQATTYFGHDWRPLEYQASGEESGESKISYTVAAKVAEGKIETSLHRQKREDDGVKTQRGPDAAKTAKPAAQAAEEWRYPLRREPISDEEVRAQSAAVEPPRHVDYVTRRAFPAGSFLFDFNRVEHLALLASRLPLPLPDEKAGGPHMSQTAAIFLVRQNRCGVMLFEIRPEPHPALTERKKKRLGANAGREEQLYIASAANALLPCRMLLGSDGRLLELTMQYATGEVVYTLDDHVMRRRAEAGRQQRIQEGPQLIRPPWW